MPRVSIKRREYKLKDLKGWIYKQMKLKGMKQADIALALGVSRGRVSQMLKVAPKKDKKEKIEPDPFSYGDLLILCELFEANDDEKKQLLTM